jgi:hypothetical protein
MVLSVRRAWVFTSHTASSAAKAAPKLCPRPKTLAEGDATGHSGSTEVEAGTGARVELKGIPNGTSFSEMLYIEEL